jgi:hypothetical protein
MAFLSSTRRLVSLRFSFLRPEFCQTGAATCTQRFLSYSLILSALRRSFILCDHRLDPRHLDQCSGWGLKWFR